MPKQANALLRHRKKGLEVWCEGRKVRGRTCVLPRALSEASGACKFRNKGFGKQDGAVATPGHFPNGRREVRVVFSLILHRFEQGAEGFGNQAAVRFCGQPSQHVGASRSTLAWHQGFTVPAEVPLNGADSGEVVHTVKEGLSGGHAPRSRACCSRLAMA